jgi:hypothetical protein
MAQSTSAGRVWRSKTLVEEVSLLYIHLYMAIEPNKVGDACHDASKMNDQKTIGQRGGGGGGGKGSPICRVVPNVVPVLNPSFRGDRMTQATAPITEAHARAQSPFPNSEAIKSLDKRVAYQRANQSMPQPKATPMTPTQSNERKRRG